MDEPAQVAVLDDNEPFLARLRLVLTRAGHTALPYSSPAEFLRAPLPTPPCCLLLDVEMPDLSGLDVQQALLRAGAAVPIVFMTGLRDVPTTIDALKAGAVDFLLKPFSDELMLAAVARAVERSAALGAARAAIEGARQRLAALSPREREVCTLVAEGLTSAQVAERLGTAESTVSVHRARIMSKLEAGSLAELVRLVDLANRSSPA